MTFWILVALAVIFLLLALAQIALWQFDRHVERMADKGLILDDDGNWKSIDKP